MTFVVLLLAVAATQAHVLAEAWLGLAAPDPAVCVGAFCALYWPRRTLPLAALAIGWGRAVVLVEPAGGQVLCALAALAAVASQRDDTSPRDGFALVWAALGVALVWSIAAWGLGQLAPVHPKGGRELFLGAALALPLCRVAPVGARLAGWTAA